MKTFLNVANAVVFGGIALSSIAIAMSTLPLEVIITATIAIIFWVCFHRLINTTKAERIAATDAGGVHWVWWILWLILFFPALIVVAIIHTGRKNRAAIRSVRVA